jgi:hypothetical protein
MYSMAALQELHPNPGNMDKNKSTATKTFSRRMLLGSLGAAFSQSAFPQSGGCRDGYERPRCPLPVGRATAPIPELFAPTGWKTIGLESFTIDVADYRKEAAFYAALLGWTLREDDGQRAIMDIGRLGSCILRAAAPDSFKPGVNGEPAPRAAIRSFSWVIDR